MMKEEGEEKFTRDNERVSLLDGIVDNERDQVVIRVVK